MGLNQSKPGTKQGGKKHRYRLKVKIPKRFRNILKKEEKDNVAEDECDAARLYLHGGTNAKTDIKINPQRSISVEANAQGELELFIDSANGLDGIPAMSSEWDGESSVISLVLDTGQEQLSSPDSLVGNPYDRRTVRTPDSALDLHYSTDSSVDDCQLCKARNIEYMVHVFLPKLQRHLNVKEILPYLHFIDDGESRALSTTEPQEVAVEKLIDAIKNYNDVLERGKWTIFITALEDTGNKYLFELLTGKTEKDHHFTAQILKHMKPSLINDIYLTQVVDLLLEREIINVEDQSQIESADKNAGPIQAVRVMLEKVDKRIPNWYTEFNDVLHEAGMSEIADVFKMIEYHEHVTHQVDVDPKPKPPVVKRKLKTAKRGKFRKHNHVACANSNNNEPSTKRMRKDSVKSLEIGGKMNMAFSMNSIVPAAETEADGWKNAIAELQKLSISMQIVETNQNELMKKFDALTNIVAKAQMN